jgi:transposase
MSRAMTETLKRRRRRFDAEFNEQAVRVVLDEGKSGGAVARDLDLTETALRQWVKRAEGDRTKGRTGLTTTEREELAPSAQRESAVGPRAGDLKNAAAFFASEPATRSR